MIIFSGRHSSITLVTNVQKSERPIQTLLLVILPKNWAGDGQTRTPQSNPNTRPERKKTGNGTSNKRLSFNLFWRKKRMASFTLKTRQCSSKRSMIVMRPKKRLNRLKRTRPKVNESFKNILYLRRPLKSINHVKD